MNESVTIPKLTELLQSEYDRHMDKYRKGCIGCINSAIAIRDLGLRLHIEIVEAEQTSRFKPA